MLRVVNEVMHHHKKLNDQIHLNKNNVTIYRSQRKFYRVNSHL